MNKSKEFLKNYNKKISSTWKGLSLFQKSLAVFLGLFIVIFLNFDITGIKGATFGWTQTDWSGGGDVLSKAGHVNNQTGWTKFFSADGALDVSGGEVKLIPGEAVSTDTSDDDFNEGNKNDNILVKNGSLFAKKPNAFKCDNNDNDICQSGRCDNTCQAKLADGAACDESSDCNNYCNSGYCSAIRPACGDLTQFTDPRDGNVYPVVSIGSYCWFAKNLAYLPEVHSNSQFSTWTLPRYGVYGYNGSDVGTAKSLANYVNYGVLYNFTAVSSGNICPPGWRSPTDSDWGNLVGALGGPSVAGGKMKITTICGSVPCWASPNTGATNSSGFSVLPGGYREGGDGSFVTLTAHAYFWSSTGVQDNSFGGWRRNIFYNGEYIDRQSDNRDRGFSARCVLN